MSNIGMRIYSNINRPSNDLIKQYRGLPVSVIADNMNRMSCMNANIRPFNENPLIGSAFTIKTRPGDNLILHKALDIAKEGDILVVDAQGDLTNAIIGELMVLWAQKRNLGGIIIDGAIRDVSALKEANIPIYAAGVSPRGPYKDGPGEINVPITCGGIAINPGDILIGDEDGIVSIDPKDAKSLVQKAKSKLESETKIIEDIDNMEWDRSWVDIALKEKNCEFY